MTCVVSGVPRHDSAAKVAGDVAARDQRRTTRLSQRRDDDDRPRDVLDVLCCAGVMVWADMTDKRIGVRFALKTTNVICIL